MTKTIFRNTFLVAVSVVLLCAILFFGMQYTQLRDETFEALSREAVYAEHALMESGVDSLNEIVGSNRITWIDPDGTVIFDSVYPLPLASQKDCPEVRDALAQSAGQCVRKSQSSGESTVYYALLCDDGTILRLSCPLSAVQDALLAISPVLWVLVLALILSAVLSFRAAKQIVKPINDLDLNHPEINKYRELEPLIDKIQEQKLTIQEEIAQRESLRREFSANVSHELKTPLTSISGFAELMAEGVVEGDKVQEFSRDIYKESQRLMALIDDIIKLSRLDEGAESPELAPVDLYDLSAEVLEKLRPVAEQENISLHLTGIHAVISGAYGLLNEMVYNLCDNAIKYNRPGGSVTVDISPASEVHLSNASLQETDICLSVRDTGIGIAPEHQKRVFERFYRVDKSHSKEIGGTGLGLSIVKHAAQFHNAELLLESEPGIGSTFTLVFHPAENA